MRFVAHLATLALFSSAARALTVKALPVKKFIPARPTAGYFSQEQ